MLMQAARSTRALMQQLMGAWGLQQHLSALWMTFFLASPALQPFLSAVHAVVRGARRDSAPLGALDLQRSLDACLAEAQQGALLPSSCLTGKPEDGLSLSCTPLAVWYLPPPHGPVLYDQWTQAQVRGVLGC